MNGMYRSLVIATMLLSLSFNCIFTGTRILEADSAPIIGTAFAANGNLYAGTCDGTLHKWDTKDWSHDEISLEITSNRGKAGLGFDAQLPNGETQEATVNKNYLIQFSLSPDNKTLAASNAHGDILLWNVENLNANYSLLIEGNGKPVFTLEWSTNSQYLAAGSTQGTMYVFEPAHKGLVAFRCDLVGSIGSMSWSPDSLQVVYSKAHFKYGEKSATIWNPFTDDQQTFDLYGGSLGVSHMQWSSNGQYIAAATFDHKIIIWDAYAGQQVNEFSIPNEYKIRTLVWSPDSKYIATIGIGGTLVVLDPSQGTVRDYPRFFEQGAAAFYNSSWSRDENMIAGGCENGCVVVFDKEEVKRLLKLERFASLFKS